MNKGARAASAHRSTDAGPDRIVCLLCGETYRAIAYWHLKRIHGFEGAHPIRDYKERFGLRVAACEETCGLLKDVQVVRHTRAGRHWTQARLLSEIRRRAGVPHGLAYSRVPDALSLAARRAYGGWDAALRAAGVDPMAHRFNRAWDRKRLTSAIQGHARRVSRVTAQWAARADPELFRAAVRLVGSWGAALRAAGLDSQVHREPRKWSTEQVEAWVRSTHAARGDIRSSVAPSGALVSVRRKAGRTWVEYVEALGIPYPGHRKRLDWTNAAVLAAIRARRRQGLALSRSGVVSDVGQALVHQARNRFGSWDAALRAAGQDPSKSRLALTWTPDLVVAAIRARWKAGKSLRHADVRRDDGRLCKAAQRTFPFSWNRAVAAAGLAGREHTRAKAVLHGSRGQARPGRARRG